MFSINDIFLANTDLPKIIDLDNDKLNSINEHNLRVADLAVKLAIAAKLDDEDINQVLLGGYLHDVGKIFLSNEILNGSKPLTNLQREEMTSHTTRGYEYLEGSTGLEKVREIILYHHERVDGTGYPKGLMGSEIPTHVKIISICDSYDAMTSYRPYKTRKLSHQDAIEELLKNCGSQFDQDLVNQFINMFVQNYNKN